MFGVVTTLPARQSGIQIPARPECYSLKKKVHTSSGTHPACYSISIGILAWGQSRQSVMSTHFHQAPRLKVSGAVPVLPLYAFMACTIKHFLSALPFFLNYVRLLRTAN
jgi:hypothetical protein